MGNALKTQLEFFNLGYGIDHRRILGEHLESWITSSGVEAAIPRGPHRVADNFGIALEVPRVISSSLTRETVSIKDYPLALCDIGGTPSRPLFFRPETSGNRQSADDPISHCLLFLGRGVSGSPLALGTAPLHAPKDVPGMCGL